MSKIKNILVLGNAGVGKTNYINRIIGNKKFERRYIPTVGVQKITSGSITYHDYPGQEFYSPKRELRGIKDIDECWIIYRSDDKVSIRDVSKWQDKAIRLCGEGPKIKVYKNEILSESQLRDHLQRGLLNL